MLRLTDLPLDVLIHIFAFISIQDLVALRQTCNALNTTTRIRSIWNQALNIHVLGQHIPLPARKTAVTWHGGDPARLALPELHELSAQELEHTVLRALRLRKNWTSGSPQCTRRVHVDITAHWESDPGAGANSSGSVEAERRARVVHNIAVRFLPGRSGRFLLTANLLEEDMGPGRREAPAHWRRAPVWCVQVWDLAAATGPGRTRCVGCLRLETHQVTGFAVNSDASSRAAIAISLGELDVVTLYAIALPPEEVQDCHDAFTPLAQLSGSRLPLLLQGSVLVTRDHNHAVCIAYLESTTNSLSEKVKLKGAALIPSADESVCLAVFLRSTFVILFREHCIDIYSLPDFSALPPDKGRVDIDCLVRHQLKWRMNSVCVGVPITYALDSNSTQSTLRPIDILLRFDSWFPWPVNMLHHFQLLPNPLYVPDLAAPTSIDIYVDPASRTPYDPRPVPVHSWQSSIQLFTPSDVALGAWGTAVWIDSDHGVPGVGESGQRIASRRLASAYAARDREAALLSSTGMDGDRDEGATALALAEAETAGAPAAAFNYDLLPGPGAPASAWGALLDSVESHASVATLQVNEQPHWVSLAVEEGEGLVAAASVGGQVEVFQYAQ